MSHYCQDCECLQTKPFNTAPERANFQQPSKYDHYANFQKFKKSKEEEAITNKRKEEHLQINPNFTDYHIKRAIFTEPLTPPNAQDVDKCSKNLNSENGEHNEDCKSHDDYDDSQNDSLSLDKRKSLLVLTRTPVQCPISVCKRTVGATLLLSHYLRDHNDDFGVPCQEIYTGYRSLLIFDSTILNYGENICLGILAYGGEGNESSSRPSARGLCTKNAFLPKPFEHLVNHLPILIMACRTTWSTLLDREAKLGIMHNPNNDDELLVLWLISPQTVKPIHGTVTVFDKSMTSSRSSIIQLRDLNQTQKPPEFMLSDINFIRLSHGEINILTQQRTEFIQMEIMIHEY